MLTLVSYSRVVQRETQAAGNGNARCRSPPNMSRQVCLILSVILILKWGGGEVDGFRFPLNCVLAKIGPGSSQGVRDLKITIILFFTSCCLRCMTLGSLRPLNPSLPRQPHPLRANPMSCAAARGQQQWQTVQVLLTCGQGPALPAPGKLQGPKPVWLHLRLARHRPHECQLEGLRAMRAVSTAGLQRL